jgi:hypothetical protein
MMLRCDLNCELYCELHCACWWRWWWLLSLLCWCSYSVKTGENGTTALQQAIDDCGDLPGGGTVLVRAFLSRVQPDFRKDNVTSQQTQGLPR